ncbi:MAG: hypothetical protein U0798_10410 [Gemmataceae bacterium]
MDIQWTDNDPETGERRFVSAEKFARTWQFHVRFRRREDWKRIEPPTREMWETLLDAMERRYQRREGIDDADLAAVRKIVSQIQAKDARLESE